MEGLCKYRDIFGRPGEGVHAFRIGGFAAVDVVLTVILAVIIAAAAGFGAIGAGATFVALVAIGEVAHRMFCVDTAGLRLIERWVA